jgi:hypothetical protein
MMARFYFDFHDADGVLPDAIMARNVALESVGETVRDLTYRHDGARVAIEVRDGDGPVLRVSAVVETTSLKE